MAGGAIVATHSWQLMCDLPIETGSPRTESCIVAYSVLNSMLTFNFYGSFIYDQQTAKVHSI